MRLSFEFLSIFWLLAVQSIAQDSSSASSASTRTSVSSASSVTSSSSTASPLVSSSILTSATSSLPASFNSTRTIASSAIPSATSSVSLSAANSTLLPQSVRLDIPYGFVGATLIITGAGLCVFGERNRWSSLFLVPFYVGALITVTIVLHYALPPTTQNPPRESIRGVFVLVAAIVGILAGAVGVVSFNISKFAIPPVGGFSFGWFLMATKQGGLTGQSLLWRWVLIAGISVAFLAVGMFERFYQSTIIVTTAWLGASVFVLGLDCFTRAGLKEFYIYNLGYRSIFLSEITGSIDVGFQFTPLMQIELALIGILAFLGAVIQFKLYAYLGKINANAEDRQEQVIKDEYNDKIRKSMHAQQLAQWEAAHGSTVGVNTGVKVVGAGLERSQSALSIEKNTGSSILDRSTMDYVPTLNLTPSRTQPSPLGMATASTTAGESNERRTDQPWRKSTQGSLIEGRADQVDLDERRKEDLLLEIQTIRKSIEILRSSTPSVLSLDSVSHLGRPNSLSLSSGYRSSDGQSLRRLLSVSVDSPRTEWETYLASRQIHRPLCSPLNPAPNLNQSQTSPWVSQADERRNIKWTAEDSRELLRDRMGEAKGPPRKAQNRSSLTRTSTLLSFSPSLVPPHNAVSADGYSLEIDKAELQARHQAKMRAMQSPVNEKFASLEARNCWEGKRQEERELMRRRDTEMKEREDIKREKRIGLEVWRESVRVEPATSLAESERGLI